MKNEERPSCNEPRDVIEDAIDFAKRDPKRAWDYNRKTSQPNKHGDDKDEKSAGGKVAARSRTFTSFAVIL